MPLPPGPGAPLNGPPPKPFVNPLAGGPPSGPPGGGSPPPTLPGGPPPGAGPAGAPPGGPPSPGPLPPLGDSAGKTKPGQVPPDAHDEGALAHHTDAAERDLNDDETNGLHPETAQRLKAHFQSAGLSGDDTQKALHGARAGLAQTSINRAHRDAGHLEQRAAAVGVQNPSSPHVKRALGAATQLRSKAAAMSGGFDKALGADEKSPEGAPPAPARPFVNPNAPGGPPGPAGPGLAGPGGPPSLPLAGAGTGA